MFVLAVDEEFERGIASKLRCEGKIAGVATVQMGVGETVAVTVKTVLGRFNIHLEYYVCESGQIVLESAVE